MSGTKKHIDKLFAEGLKNFSLLVSNKDLEAIDDKASLYKEQEIPGTDSMFGAFEIEVDENDWLSTKAKLESEKAVLSQDNFMSSGFRDFEMELKGDDWTKTYRKLQVAKKRRVAYWWWLSAGIIVLALGLFIVSQQFQGDETPVLTENVQTPQDPQNIENPVKESLKENQGANGNETVMPETSNTDVKTSEGKADKLNKPENKIAQKQSFRNTNTSRNSHTNPSNGLNNSLNEIPKTNLAQNMIEPQKAAIKSDAGLLNSMSVLPGNKDEINKVQENKAVNTDAETMVKTDVKVPDAPKEPLVQVPTDTNKNKKADKQIPPILKVPNARLYVAAVTQVGSTFRKLDKQNNAKYNDIRNNAEKPFTQWTYGIEFGVQKKKSQFSIGVQSTNQSWSSNYNYKNMYYTDSILVYDTGHVLIKTLYFNPKDTSIHEQQVIKINKVQVPFEFSQFWTLSPKMNFMATVGGTIGFNTSTLGSKIVHPTTHYLRTYDQMKSYERTVSFAPSLSLGVQYQFSKNFTLQGTAFGNYSATSRFKSSFPVKDFPYTIGGSIKLLYFIK